MDKEAGMKIRIYQINLGRDLNHVCFIGLDRLAHYQGSADVDSSLYDKVYEGEVDSHDPEDVYRIFNLDHPEGYTGHSLSVSDVIEVIGERESTFHFCDLCGFRMIPFYPELTGSIVGADAPVGIIDLSYQEMASRFRAAERDECPKHLIGYIVFTEDSFTKHYSRAARTYRVSSDNKAYRPNMGGYSIYASCIDGTDPLVRLEGYMANEKGGADGWKVERCFMKEPTRTSQEEV